MTMLSRDDGNDVSTDRSMASSCKKSTLLKQVVMKNHPPKKPVRTKNYSQDKKGQNEKKCLLPEKKGAG